MTERTKLESLFAEFGCTDFKWIDPDKIAVRQWVRMKCMFGCKDFGKTATCPPNTPAVAECQKLFWEYHQMALFHFAGAVAKPEDRHAWTKKINGNLLKLERAVFLAGYHKALVLYVDPCNFCEDCAPAKRDCLLPASARPSLEALSVDVFETARGCGYEIQVLTDYTEQMNRFGLLMIA
jgi:predicted metal-binding protein